MVAPSRSAYNLGGDRPSKGAVGPAFHNLAEGESKCPPRLVKPSLDGPRGAKGLLDLRIVDFWGIVR